MRYKNIIPFMILLFVTTLSSCNKFLEKQSNNSFAVPDQLSDLQALLDDADVMNERRTPAYGESSSDDYFLLSERYASLRDQLKHIYTWEPHDYLSPNDWSYSYLPIYNSNYCLETLEKIPITNVNKSEWKNVKGSSLFFRAYYFLNLTWIYSNVFDKNTSENDLGIVLRLGSDFNVKSVRSTVKETYDRIIRDAREAILYLPDLPKHPMRPSKVAAYGLMARTYLSMMKYDSAFKYANLCLEIKHDLMDLNDLINPDANVPFQPFNAEIIFYTGMTSANSTVGTNIALVDTSLFTSYKENDLRKSVYFRPNGIYQRFKGSYAADASKLFSGIAVDEIYLIRAECNARANNLTDALHDINWLMSNRWKNTSPYTNFTASTNVEALEKILLERRKELLFRGLRWIDIKRLNKEGQAIVLKRKIGENILLLEPNDNRYALPIPIDIINLTGIQQNPK